MPSGHVHSAHRSIWYVASGTQETGKFVAAICAFQGLVFRIILAYSWEDADELAETLVKADTELHSVLWVEELTPQFQNEFKKIAGMP